RFARYAEVAALADRPHDRVLIFTRPDEDTVVNPLRLDKLKLSAEVGSHECKHQTSISAIIFQYAFRKQRAVSGAASYHSMYSGNTRDLGIARVRAPDV